MGTRFLMTQESPVPAATKERYLKAGVDDVFVTKKLDGMSHRMLRNELAARIERASGAGMLVTALANALALKRLTGASLGDMLRSAAAMARSGDMSLCVAMLAANSPCSCSGRSYKGTRPRASWRAGRSRAGSPICRAAELVERIVREAEAGRPQAACGPLPPRDLVGG